MNYTRTKHVLHVVVTTPALHIYIQTQNTISNHSVLRLNELQNAYNHEYIFNHYCCFHVSVPIANIHVVCIP